MMFPPLLMKDSGCFVNCFGDSVKSRGFSVNVIGAIVKKNGRYENKDGS